MVQIPIHLTNSQYVVVWAWPNDDFPDGAVEPMQIHRYRDLCFSCFANPYHVMGEMYWEHGLVLEFRMDLYLSMSLSTYVRLMILVSCPFHHSSAKKK